MFNTIGIITKPNDPRSDDKARELAIFLKNKNVAVVKDDEQIIEQADLQKHSNLLKTIGTRWYALRLKWKT
jgi:NAD kinase